MSPTILYIRALFKNNNSARIRKGKRYAPLLASSRLRRLPTAAHGATFLPPWGAAPHRRSALAPCSAPSARVAGGHYCPPGQVAGRDCSRQDRVADGSHPPPAPTERSVRIVRTTPNVHCVAAHYLNPSIGRVIRFTARLSLCLSRGLPPVVHLSALPPPAARVQAARRRAGRAGGGVGEVWLLAGGGGGSGGGRSRRTGAKSA